MVESRCRLRADKRCFFSSSYGAADVPPFANNPVDCRDDIDKLLNSVLRRRSFPPDSDCGKSKPRPCTLSEVSFEWEEEAAVFDAPELELELSSASLVSEA